MSKKHSWFSDSRSQRRFSTTAVPNLRWCGYLWSKVLRELPLPSLSSISHLPAAKSCTELLPVFLARACSIIVTCLHKLETLVASLNEWHEHSTRHQYACAHGPFPGWHPCTLKTKNNIIIMSEVFKSRERRILYVYAIFPHVRQIVCLDEKVLITACLIIICWMCPLQNRFT